MGDQQSYCRSHERPAANAAVLLMAVFPDAKKSRLLGLPFADRQSGRGLERERRY